MANTGTGDVADVDGRRAERLQIPGRGEYLLKGAWPTGILIEQISFGLTAASHQNPVERLIRSRSRQLVPVLAFTISIRTTGSSSGNASRSGCSRRRRPGGNT